MSAKEASEGLKDELASIFLICFWMSFYIVNESES